MTQPRMEPKARIIKALISDDLKRRLKIAVAVNETTEQDALEGLVRSFVEKSERKAAA